MKDAQIAKLVKKYQKKLGLTEWEVDSHIGGAHSEVVTDELRGRVEYVYTGRVATISINPMCPEWNLKEVVIHELLHLLLADLHESFLKHAPEDARRDYDAKVHAVIRRLEQII